MILYSNLREITVSKFFPLNLRTQRKIPATHCVFVAITDPDAYRETNPTAKRVLELATGLLAARYVFFPVCTNSCHWVLFLLDVDAWRLEVYDSKHGQHWQEYTRIRRWIDRLLLFHQQRTDLMCFTQVCVDAHTHTHIPI